MAVRATFTGFDPYRLNGVTVTDQVLGHGSYATVLELEYMGLKCAGKKIHELLLEQGNTSYTIRRFEEECRLLSQIRHPNIVQFLGVHFQQGVPAPILVMEFLPTNLASYIEQYGILPKEISYSILHDVSLGLRYFHGQTSPIIHRDLSANNVLLTPNMTAKISDLGVARILTLTALQVSRMTGTPGTPAYMPPEVMIANPKYDTSVDEFSYGILMIHMFSGRWPEPQVGPIQIDSERLVPVSEAQRRKVFLRAIGNDHPLMDLILRCINNDPRCRVHANEIVERLTAIALEFPAPFTNRVEILRQTEQQEEEKRVLREEREAENQQKDQQILSLRKEAEEKKEEIVRLNLVSSSKVEQLKLEVRDLKAQNQLLTATKEADVTELNTKVAVYEDQIEEFEARIENIDKIMQQERKQFESHIEKDREQFETQQVNDRKRFEVEMAKEREGFETQIEKERESSRRLVKEKHQLQAEISQSVSNMNSLKHENSTLKAEALRSGSELEAKTRALEEKDTIISGMREQLTRSREYLSSKQQIVQASIIWKLCADIPIKYHSGKTTVINGKVYCGGGMTDHDDDEYIVFCYDPSLDYWTTLPLLPVRYFGLGQVNSKLVAVGGVKKGCDEPTNVIFTYDDRSRKWKQTLPPMPTVRFFPAVLSLQSALVVAGGVTSSGDTDAVEIFKEDTSQWYKTDRLPTTYRDISLVVIGSICYALGGIKLPSHLNQALYASVDDLLRNTVPANQTTHSVSSADTQSAWKILPNTPTYGQTAAVLAGNLLAIGDDKTSREGADMKEVYMFSPSTNSWIYISDLPEPRYASTVAVLSSTEILVIGGWRGSCRVNSVYKGTLSIKL